MTVRAIYFAALAALAATASLQAAQAQTTLKQLPALKQLKPQPVKPSTAAQTKAQTGFTPLGALPVVVSPSAPIGSYADYSITDGSTTEMMRWSLVGRPAGQTALELVFVPNGQGPAHAPFAARITLKPEADYIISEVVVQPAGGKPTLMPTAWAQAQGGVKAPDPSGLVGSEQIEIAGKKYETSRYEQKSAQGRMEIWLSPDAAPIGLVKMAVTPAKPGAKPIVATLVKTGGGAPATITGASVRFGSAPETANAVSGGKQ